MKNWDTVTITLNRYIEEETDRKTESNRHGWKEQTVAEKSQGYFKSAKEACVLN